MPVPRRLSVLPFKAMGCDSAGEFQIGLPDAIALALAPLHSLISHYGERPYSDFFLGGTVCSAGRFVRLELELSGQRQIIQTTPDDLFSLQDQSVQWVLEALNLRLSGRERELLHRDVPCGPDGYELYLRGNCARIEEDGLALALYRESVKADSDYAPAWVRLADVETSASLAREALDRCLGLNPDIDAAHAMYARLEIENGETREAIHRVLGRLNANANSAELFAALALACRLSGLFAESERFAAEAKDLDPEICIPEETAPERIFQEALARLSAGEGFAALLLLSDAVAKGFYPAEYLETARCFDILRDNPEFHQVVARAITGQARAISVYRAGGGPQLLAVPMRQ